MASGKRKREEICSSHQCNKSDEPGINPALKAAVVDGNKCSTDIMEARKQIFEKQIQPTQKLRGNANVRYAWFASSTDAPSSSVYGAGNDWPKLGNYGYGVHLTVVDAGNNSATICDVDKKGVRYMVLCCVILGNMELVSPGSKQLYPSAECFDTGVDNLEKPTHYVVWSMNMKTHICPEYAVSFKTSPNTEGNLILYGSMDDLSLRVATQNHEVPLPSVGSSTSKSHAMPFAKIFEAIADKVSPSELQQVQTMYESFKGKEMSQEEFVRRLISTVGNHALRSALSGLKSSRA